MAEIYVRTSGNDTTGTGLTGAPYATLKKALTVATAGDQIIMGTGTYAEDSGSGYLVLTTSFSGYVFVSPESGNLGDVVITNASGVYGMAVGNATFVMFKNIVFRSKDNTVLGTIRMLGGTASNIRFAGCRIEVIGASGSTNSAVVSSWTSGSALSKVQFFDCEVREIGPYYTAGINLDCQVGAATAFEFSKCKIHVGYFPVRLKGMTGLILDDLDILAFNPSVAGTGLQLGEDAATGVAVTARLSRVRVRAATGHAAVIGAGCSDVRVDDCSFHGGENASNGQGLVIKNATGARVTRSQVYGGYLSGMYLKACSGVLVEDCEIYNRYSTSAALRYGINVENNSKASRNIIRECRFHADVGTLFDWSTSSGDDGGSICDQNVYTLSGSATWGSVRGSTISSLADLRAAWAGYDRPGNDQNSLSGLAAMRPRGNRSLALG